MAKYCVCLTLIVFSCVFNRCTELQKEVAVLKEKIHHLDDMLKSQQRKVRHMIEQVFVHTHTHTLEMTSPLPTNAQEDIYREIRF